MSETWTNSPTLSLTPSDTLTVTFSATVTPSATQSATYTNTPYVTPTVGPDTHVYPNPFNPDKGEVFHLGNVNAGDTVAIYNIIGELVRSFKLTGDPTKDVWDGVNNNGVRVTTGVYFMKISSIDKIFRVAILHGSQ
jgi:hypothetical protein